MPPEVENAAAGAQPADATKNPGVVGQEGEKAEGQPAEGEQRETPEGAGEGEGKGEQPGAAGGKPKLTPEQRIQFGLQKRVGRLTNERATLKAENEQLRAQLASQQPQPEEGEGEEQKPHLTEQDVERRARELAAQRVEQQRLTGLVESTLAAGTKAYPKEFDGLVAVVDDAIGGFADRNNKITPIGAAILESEKPHELIHHLAENPELAEELAALPPARQIRRIAQIEIEMGEASQPRASSAPKPIPASRSSGGSVQKDPAKMSDKEWYEERQKKR